MSGFAFPVYYGLGWIKSVFPELTGVAKMLLFEAIYIGLLAIAARHPNLTQDEPDAQIPILPRPRDVAVTGLYFLLPIFVLVWNLLVDRLSPSYSTYWATLTMIFIVFTQHPLKALLRRRITPTADLLQKIAYGLSLGAQNFIEGMIGDARNMIGIAVATGAAGVIIGTVSLTGAHQVIGEFVEYLSGGNLMAMLLLVALISLILGMGLPTTANYIVVSSMMAPVIVSVGAQSGLIVPLVAAHLFVFYFGILADDTPPVGLANFAAAAISGGDPIRTGIQSFSYDLRTALLPFLFIFSTELLLIDVSITKAVVIFIVATGPMMVFAAATQGYFFARSRLWESLVLILVALTLLRPGFWLDRFQDPYDSFSGINLVSIADTLPAAEKFRLVIAGPDFGDPDEIYQRTIVIHPTDYARNTDGLGTGGLARLEAAGLSFTNPQLGQLQEPLPGTAFFETFKRFDFYGDIPVTVTLVHINAERLPKELFYMPAVLLLGFIIAVQRRRQTIPTY
jgi:hypothetical protein